MSAAEGRPILRSTKAPVGRRWLTTKSQLERPKTDAWRRLENGFGRPFIAACLAGIGPLAYSLRRDASSEYCIKTL